MLRRTLNRFQTKFPRSKFEYKSSAKGDEVGARNEAAFIDYKAYKPKTMEEEYMMPHKINLLSTVVLECGIIATGTLTMSLVLWRFYASRAYELVVIDRPPRRR